MSNLLWGVAKSIAFHFFIIVLVSLAVILFSGLLVGVVNALSLHK